MGIIALDSTSSHPFSPILHSDTNTSFPLPPHNFGLSKDAKYPGLPPITFVDSELDLFNSLESLVLDLDPDVLTSFELQNGGWGYVGTRYQSEFGGDVSYGSIISRLLPRATGAGGGWAPGWRGDDEPNFLSTGRHVLNLWGIFRKEYTHLSYTFENCVFQILGRR